MTKKHKAMERIEHLMFINQYANAEHSIRNIDTKNRNYRKGKIHPDIKYTMAEKIIILYADKYTENHR